MNFMRPHKESRKRDKRFVLTGRRGKRQNVRETMKKAVWLTGFAVIIFMLVIGCYLIFFREKDTGVQEGTFVKQEGMWDAWQQNA